MIDRAHPIKEENFQIAFPCIRIEQPIGEFYCASIKAKDLVQITNFDIRRLVKEKRDFETYLGIQRPLNGKRVTELKSYVNTVDACFPTAVLLAVEPECALYDVENNIMTLNNVIDEDGYAITLAAEIAKVLDGQHRIAGLAEYTKDNFDINVSIFVDIDIAEQAYIFSTVNLAQTKVNKS